MKLKDCFNTFPVAGTCEVNRDKMEKGFNCLCRIYKYGHPAHSNVAEYTLLEFSPRAKRKFRCSISKDDAEWIIRTFNLYEVPTRGANNSVFVPTIIV